MNLLYGNHGLFPAQFCQGDAEFYVRAVESVEQDAERLCVKNGPVSPTLPQGRANLGRKLPCYSRRADGRK
jgi:hypothetical protein